MLGLNKTSTYIRQENQPFDSGSQYQQMIALKLFLYFLLLYRSVSSRPVEEELEHDGQLVFLQTVKGS